MDKAKLKIYAIYFALFISGIVFFILVPIVVLFLLFLTGYAVISLKIPLAVIAIIDGGIMFWFWKKKKIDFYIVLSSLIATIILISFFVIISSRISTSRSIIHRDGRRMRDIKQLELALELYHKDNGNYPIVSIGCHHISVLDDFLIPVFVPAVPREQFEAKGHPPYEYASSGDGSRYVLKATIEKESSALQQDLDESVLGCNCDDPNYCVGINKNIN